MPLSMRHKSIRLDPRNYVGVGWYFLTLCTFRRTPYFRNDPLARWLLRALRDESRQHSFHLRAYCLLPNHLHLLLQGATPEADLQRFVRHFKHKTSFRFAARTGKKLWQMSFYDHILRGSEAPSDVAWYIWLNPVRAKLVEKPGDYPYSGPHSPAWPGSSPPSDPWSPPLHARF